MKSAFTCLNRRRINSLLHALQLKTTVIIGFLYHAIPVRLSALIKSNGHFEHAGIARPYAEIAQASPVARRLPHLKRNIVADTLALPERPIACTACRRRKSLSMQPRARSSSARNMLLPSLSTPMATLSEFSVADA